MVNQGALQLAGTFSVPVSDASFQNATGLGNNGLWRALDNVSGAANNTPYTPAGSNWTFQNHAGITSGTGWGVTPYPNGTQAAASGYYQAGTLQNFNNLCPMAYETMNFPAAGTYTISFEACYNTAGYASPAPMYLYFGGGVSNGSSTGTLEGSITPASKTAWTPYSISFNVATAGNYQVCFQGYGSGNKNEIDTFTDVTETANVGGNVLPIGTALTVANGASMDLHGASQQVASLSDSVAGGGTVTNSATNPVTLTLGATNASTAVFSGVISDNASGPLSLHKSGNFTQVLLGANTYTGATTVNGGILAVANGASGSATGTGAVTVSGSNVALTADTTGMGVPPAGGTISGLLTVNNNAAFGAINGQTLTLGGGLTLGTISENLNITGSASTSDLINVSGGSLAVGGANTVTINLTGSPQPGIYPLMGFATPITTQSAAFTLSATVKPAGYNYNLIDANGGSLLELQVVQPVGMKLWYGFGGNFWDAATTSNWKDQTNNNASATFRNGDNVTFDDTAAQFSVSITGTGVSPATVTFSNATAQTYTYTFSGGGINGPTTSLVLSGTGDTVVLANTNGYGGGTVINATNTLQLGDGTASVGAIGGNITNNGAMVFNNPSPQTFSGAISGGGKLTAEGSGLLTLTGNNSYAGGTTINGGAMLNASAALGSGAVTLNHGTLQFGGVLDPSAAGMTLGAGGGTLDTNGNNENPCGRDRRQRRPDRYLLFAQRPAGPGRQQQQLPRRHDHPGRHTAVGQHGRLGHPLDLVGLRFQPGHARHQRQSREYRLAVGALRRRLEPYRLARDRQRQHQHHLLRQYRRRRRASQGGWRHVDAQRHVQLHGAHHGDRGRDCPGQHGRDRLARRLHRQRQQRARVRHGGQRLRRGDFGALAGSGNINLTTADSAPIALTVGGNNQSTTYSGVLSDGGLGSSLTMAGTGSMVLTAANAYAGGTTISAGTLQLGTGAPGLDGSLATNGVTNNAALVYNLAGAQTASYPISGAGALSKLGGGTLSLAGNNSYGGATTVGGGLLLLASSSAAAPNSAFTVNAGAQLALAGGAGPTALGSLAGAGSVAWNSNALTVGGNNQSTVYSGALSGATSLVKTGSGTFTFLSTVPMTNTVTVNQGTLVSTVAAVGGAPLVLSGGTFQPSPAAAGLNANYYYNTNNITSTSFNNFNNTFLSGYTPILTNNITANVNAGNFDFGTNGAYFPATVRNQNGAIFAANFNGYFYAATTGSYTFNTYSDDGSMLWIGSSDTAVSQDGGSHGMTNSTNTPVTLTAGTYYPITVGYNNSGGGYGLQVSYTPPGGGSTLLPVSLLCTATPVATYSGALTVTQNSAINLPAVAGTAFQFPAWPSAARC